MEPPNKKRRTTPLSSLATDGTVVDNSHGTIINSPTADLYRSGDQKNAVDANNGRQSPKVGRTPTLSALSASVTEIDETSLADFVPKEDQLSRDLLLSFKSANQVNTKHEKAPSAGSNPKVVNQPEEEADTNGATSGLVPVFGPQLYHCDACQKDISDAFRVRCAECRDFDLCVACFSSGVETGSHLNTHAYIPTGRNDFPLFSPDWSADEELMLLEGVSKFGFGNWSEVADLVGPYSSQGKKKQECEEHYYTVHIAPYREKVEAIETVPSSGPRKKIIEAKQRLHAKMIGPGNPPAPANTTFSTHLGSSCNVVGYMPLRGDFDVEYDNDAELILADIEFRGDETPQERELKLKVLDIYNAKLDERVLRKRVVIEKGLSDWRKLQQQDKRRTREEAELYNLFKLLARYDLTPDHDELLQLFLHERKLRERVLHLQEWRSLGLHSYEEVEAYEKSKLSTLSGLPSYQLPSSAQLPTEESTPVTPGSNRFSTRRSGAEVLQSTSTKIPSSPVALRLPGTVFTLQEPASRYPGANLLSIKELEFCDSLHLPPIYFLFTKHTLLRSMVEHGDPFDLLLSKDIRLDGVKQGSLYDFVLHSKVHLPQPISPSPYPLTGTTATTTFTPATSTPAARFPSDAPHQPQQTAMSQQPGTAQQTAMPPANSAFAPVLHPFHSPVTNARKTRRRRNIVDSPIDTPEAASPGTFGTRHVPSDTRQLVEHTTVPSDTRAGVSMEDVPNHLEELVSTLPPLAGGGEGGQG